MTVVGTTSFMLQNSSPFFLFYPPYVQCWDRVLRASTLQKFPSSFHQILVIAKRYLPECYISSNFDSQFLILIVDHGFRSMVRSFFKGLISHNFLILIQWLGFNHEMDDCRFLRYFAASRVFLFYNLPTLPD
jgi:hypothetical protein